jgi:branched-subunit amino acid aminotransferase/4-amino-4-deoxychorismate lyase
MFDSLALTDIAEQRPGVYTVARTYHRDRVLRFDLHLTRLENSARRAGIKLGFDHAWLRKALRASIDELQYAESRFCIAVPTSQPHLFYLAFEPLRPVPEAILRHGAHVRTVMHARARPRVKATGWIAERREIRMEFPPEVYEVVLVDEDGALLEGTGSNVFFVRNGTLRTADTGVLKGTARAVLLDIAPAVLPVDLHPVRRADLPCVSEMMLSSSSRGVVPVTQIDDLRIGNGCPGPIAVQLRQRYETWAEAHLEPL